jgi:hypothetical protein
MMFVPGFMKNRQFTQKLLRADEQANSILQASGAKKKTPLAAFKTKKHVV